MKTLLQMILLAVFLCGTEEIISGRVQNSDGSEIPVGQVNLDGTELTAITNANGEFTIPATARSIDFINNSLFHRKISILDDSGIELTPEKSPVSKFMSLISKRNK